MTCPDMTGAEEGDLYQDIYDYDFRRHAEFWPNFDNYLVPFSLERLVQSHALDYAEQIVVPYLGVAGSAAVTRPDTERFIAAKKRGGRKLKLIDSARRIQSYDRPKYVDQAVEALGAFFGEHLSS
jgi:fermentation-respiration switch protein FrsA (DUF1100 family)